MTGNSCEQLPPGITGTGPLIGPPAFISVPESGEGFSRSGGSGSGEGVLGVVGGGGGGGEVLGGMAGVLGAVWMAPPGSLVFWVVSWLVACAPAKVGACSIPHITPTMSGISTSPTSAALRVVSRPSMRGHCTQ
jgi:hypothetical protein